MAEAETLADVEALPDVRVADDEEDDEPQPAVVTASSEAMQQAVSVLSDKAF